MRRPRVIVVVGARPNFVKAAPLVRELAETGSVDVELLHTGQHYDPALSGAFFDQLDLPAPTYHLGVGAGTHAEQTAAVILGVEDVLDGGHPDAIVVVGDVNSTMGAALVAAKAGVPIVHLEAGLRSRDRRMPEETNRVVTDCLADLLLCHCQEAVDNLVAEGIAPERIALVGNTMIDSLLRLLPVARDTGIVERLGLEPRGYALVTLHRPALVDDPGELAHVIAALAEIAASIPVIFPVHPRTRQHLEQHGEALTPNIRILEPLHYLEFVGLQAAARVVITDSGGVQEETSALGTPCFTYRTTTERSVTIELGTNVLVGTDPARLVALVTDELAAPRRVPNTPIPYWDGQAGARAAQAILRMISR